MRLRPAQTRQYTGQWAGEIGNGIGDDWQPERPKPRGIAVGIENQAIALRLQPRDHAVENGTARDLAHRLVAAAHPPRQPAGEQHAGN